MNNYIMKRINIYGTEAQMLEAIRDLFINNTVMRFSVEDENLTDTPDEKNYVMLKNDDYILSVYGYSSINDYDSITITLYLYKNNEVRSPLFTMTVSTNSSNVSVSRTTSASRIINIFIVKGDNLDFINISGSKSTFGKNGSPFYMRMATSDVGLVYCLGPSTSYEVVEYETKSLSYTINPYHTIAAPDDTLVLDSELPLRDKTSAEYYSGIIKDCFGLGGGKAGTFYKDKDPDRTPIYCFKDSCCFRLENKVEM